MWGKIKIFSFWVLSRIQRIHWPNIIGCFHFHFLCFLGKDSLQTKLQQLRQNCTRANALDRHLSKLIFSRVKIEFFNKWDLFEALTCVHFARVAANPCHLFFVREKRELLIILLLHQMRNFVLCNCLGFGYDHGCLVERERLTTYT